MYYNMHLPTLIFNGPKLIRTIVDHSSSFVSTLREKKEHEAKLELQWQLFHEQINFDSDMSLVRVSQDIICAVITDEIRVSIQQVPVLRY
jgi:hypothetical protein